LKKFFSDLFRRFEKSTGFQKREEPPFAHESSQILHTGNNISVSYTDEGAGSFTIVFIHGLASYSSAWKNNVEELKKRYRCITLDLPGYGKSSKDYYSVSLNWYAEVIYTFCRKMQLKNIVLAGHSMGGQISIMLAYLHPELIEKLILVAPAGFEKFSFLQKKMITATATAHAVKNITDEQAKQNIRLNFFKMPADAEFMIAERLKLRQSYEFEYYCHIVPQCIKAMLNEPVWEILPEIKQETLIVFGEKDNLIPNPVFSRQKTESIAKAGAARMPFSELLIIPEAGHFVMFEKPKEFNNAVTDFLK
jgi:pimeloyl-ACP methyl ester carboxylesterase